MEIEYQLNAYIDGVQVYTQTSELPEVIEASLCDAEEAINHELEYVYE